MYVKHQFLLLAILIGWLSGQAQVNAPTVHCISVDEVTGNVTLTWTPPADPNGQFFAYLLQVSNNQTGPFTDITVPTIGTTSYTHTVNANLGMWFYRVRTIYVNAGVQDTSAAQQGTLRTMLPQFVNTTDSTARVGWNPTVTGGLPGDATDYDVYRRMGAGNPWQLIGTRPLANRLFLDSFKVCSEDIAFKVEIANAQGNCVSSSAVIEQLFEDNTAPDIPPFDSVSVNPVTGDLILGWQPSASGDTRGYQIIYRDLIAQQNIVIDSTIGRPNTNYTDTLASGNTGARQYGVAAFDTCFKGVPPESNVSSIEGWHRTVFLEVTPDYCGNQNLLTWQHYVGWDTISHYEILVSINGGGFTRIDTVAFPDSTYIHEGVDLTNDYCYIARAANPGRVKTSSSNVACPAAAGTIVPGIHYIINATVVNNERVLVNAVTDSSIDANFYSLKRALSLNGPYFEVDRIPFTGSPNITLIDTSARVTETDYYYYIDITDSCEFVLASSNTVKTIYLRGEFNKITYLNEVDWTPYLGWDSAGSGVEEYEVYRILNKQQELVPATTTGAGGSSFEEDMTPLMDQGLQVCYIVRATEADGNVNGFRAESFSNSVCLGDNAKIFVPSAFRPFGFNRVFIPVMAFADFTQYSFRIFDRFGTMVFETTDPKEGWDGSYNGNTPGNNVFAWELRVVNIAGDELIRRGSVVLLR